MGGSRFIDRFGSPTDELDWSVEAPEQRREEPTIGVIKVAAALVLVVVVGAVLADGGSDVGPEPVASPRVADSTPSNESSPAPGDEAGLGGVGFQTVGGVTAGGPGLVAVGSVGFSAAVSTSVDGIEWSPVSPIESAGDGVGGGARMSAVIAGGPGLVAVGSAGFVDQVAVVWTSVDGVVWSRVPHDEAVFGGERHQDIESVVAAGPGLVAVGWAGPGGDQVAVVWTSVDGVVWSRVPHDEAVFGGDDHQEMSSVVAAAPGLVAVGREGSGGDQVAVVWTSVDGVVWSRAPDDDAVFAGERSEEMSSVIVVGPGLVAVGRDGSGGDQVAAVWTSADGIAWSRMGQPAQDD